MSDPVDDIDWITINQSADSLLQLIGSGGYTATSVGRTEWLNLPEDIGTEPYCNSEGFNVEMSMLKMRVGITMNNEDECYSNDNLLGFGNEIAGHPWGDWAVVGGGIAGANTSAYGWIFVR